MVGPLRIELLADHREALPRLHEWFATEWAPWYGPDGPGDAAADLADCCRRDGMPLAVVALRADEVLGTAALRAESVTTHPHLTPWLAALLVGPPHRRRGVAESLIAAIEDRARAQGFDRIHVGTGAGSGTPESALRRRGWAFVERAPYYVSTVSIFRKLL